MSIVVLQSSRWGRESWLLCFVYLPGAMVCLPFVIVVFPDHVHYFCEMYHLGLENVIVQLRARPIVLG